MLNPAVVGYHAALLGGLSLAVKPICWLIHRLYMAGVIKFDEIGDLLTSYYYCCEYRGPNSHPLIDLGLPFLYVPSISIDLVNSAIAAVLQAHRTPLHHHIYKLDTLLIHICSRLYCSICVYNIPFSP